jgi:hypothetical protein
LRNLRPNPVFKLSELLVLGCTANQAFQPATTQYQVVFLIREICEICGQIPSVGSPSKAGERHLRLLTGPYRRPGISASNHPVSSSLFNSRNLRNLRPNPVFSNYWVRIEISPLNDSSRICAPLSPSRCRSITPGPLETLTESPNSVLISPL